MGFGLQIGFIAQSFVALVALCDDDDPSAATSYRQRDPFFAAHIVNDYRQPRPVLRAEP